MSAEIELSEQRGKAIEVATMLGDSVVDVKHCMDPHSGKITSRTWALLATGALCVLVSAIAFYVSVKTAAYNKGALEYWTHVAHKPAYAYRAQQLSGGYDWLAFGGFAIGIVSLAGALLRIRDERKSPYYRIGTAPGVEQPLEGAPSPSFPLVAPHGDDFVFNFGTGMTGEAIIDGRATPLAELAAKGHARPSMTQPGAFELPLALTSRIRTKVGQTQFVVSPVAKPRRQSVPLFAGLQSRTMSYFAGSLGVHLGIVLLLSYIPVEAGTASIDLAMHEETDIRAKSVIEENTPPEERDAVDDGGAGSEGASAQMALAEGAAGTTKSDRKDGHMRMKNNNIDPAVARIQAIEEARTAGILGSVSLQSGDAFASLTATDNLSSGPDDANVYGAIYGADGESFGYFGYGRSGFGAGGGCTGGTGCDGIIGTRPGYGKIGLGKFGRSGWDGPGGGVLGTRKHPPGVPTPIIGQPDAKGGLDKSIIRRYIKRNIDKIKYCYEKQLLAKPGLEGTVSVSFFITPAGSVTSSTGAGVDPTVANCVADVVSTIEFPRPDGGGVQVNYPFTFHPAGQ
ncbi:MAG TPA: AgmX/PglI C-terminal domain-containing protein [Kofleriaceae bacterium]|nr:AgmX/PglI C-terminal domain-containing protein [Kofleriaceae bacterium]